MGFFKMKLRCPYCASELDKKGECSCSTFQAVKKATAEDNTSDGDKITSDNDGGTAE